MEVALEGRGGSRYSKSPKLIQGANGGRSKTLGVDEKRSRRGCRKFIACRPTSELGRLKSAPPLSVRLPWHDRGWDGRVGDRPTANVFCTGEYGLKAHGIREGKKDVEEEARRSKPCAFLPADTYRPPCLQTIQTFGGTAPLWYKHKPKAHAR